MPIVASFGAMTVRGLGLFSATAGPSYWIGRLLASSSGIGSRGVAIDPSGNVYLCGASTVSASLEIQLAKYSSSGTLAWQVNLGTAGTDESGSGVAVDSSGNVYITGAAGGVFQIAKYTTAGTLSWQRSLSGESGSGLDATVDSSGNVYVCGYSNSGGVGYLQLAKYDTSGSLAWKQRLNGGSDAAFNGVAVDSSGNVFVCGYFTSANYKFQIAKYSSAGALSWQRTLGTAGVEDFGQAVALDASGDVYILGSSNAGGNYNLLLAKYSSAGTFQWQRKLGSGGTEQGNSVAVDGSTPANVYVCGLTNTSGTNDFLIAKYSAAGVIAWQRRLGSTATSVAFGIKADSSDNIYVCGITDNADFLFAKLPGDGSLTGVYTVGGNSYTYAATTLTEDAASLTDAASSLASSTSTLTDGATSLTSATSTLTSYVTTI